MKQTLLGMTISLSPELAKQEYEILFKHDPSSNTTLRNFSQPLNALFLIVYTLLGMTISLSMHSEKQKSPILSRCESGSKTTSRNCLQ